MSEHTTPKVVILPLSITRDQLLAQCYDMKESVTMMLVVVERYKKELRSMEKKVQNMITLVEGLGK